MSSTDASASTVMQELALLRELLVTGLGEIRAEVAALKNADAALLSRVDALEAAATTAAGTETGTETGTEGAASAGARAAAAASTGATVDEDAVRTAAQIQARALYDEAEARASERRSQVRTECVQCGAEFFPGLACKGDCSHHALAWRSHGTRYIYPCCGVEFRASREADFVPGCVRSDHSAVHHTRFRYTRHSTWLAETRKARSSTLWEDIPVQDMADIPKFVAVGTAMTDAPAPSAESPQAEPAASNPDAVDGYIQALYVVLGRGSNSWGSRMTMWSATELMELAGKTEPGAAAEVMTFTHLDLLPTKEQAAAASSPDAWASSMALTVVDGPVDGVATFLITATIQVVAAAGPATITIPFQVAGSTISRMGAVSTHGMPVMPSSKLAGAPVEELAAALPGPQVDGEFLRTDPAPALSKHKCVGDSSLKLKAAGPVTAGQSLGSESFTNFFTVPVKVMNPSESKAALIELSGFFLDASGTPVPVETVRLGDASGSSFADSPSLTLDSMGVENVTVQFAIPVDGRCGSTFNLRARAAASLPQPLVLRIVGEDMMGEEVSLDVEQANEPLDLYTLDSYASYNKVAVSSFVAADNADTLERHFVAVYRKEREVVMRTSMSTSYTLSHDRLDAIAYAAHMAGNTVHPLADFTLKSSGSTIEFAALVHEPETMGPVYGMAITVATPTMRVCEHIMLPRSPNAAEAIEVETTTIGPSAKASFSYTINELGTSDWFAVLAVGAPNSTYSEAGWYEHPPSSAGDSGTLTFTTPSKRGDYVVRFFPNSQLSKHTVESNVFTVA